jgi:2,5-diketo-D-gluconate reductase B
VPSRPGRRDDLLLRRVHVTTVQGADVPSLGYGTWLLQGNECERGVAHALDVGYRHLDTAQAYENEDRVGRALASSEPDREDVFLTTKLWMNATGRDRVGPATEESLRKLRTDYVDLLLIHWPDPDVPLAETLGAMEGVREAGRVRHVGVSNFPPSWTRAALEEVRIFADQVEFHPFLGQGALLELAREHDFLVTAYSPLARGKVGRDPTLREIAESHGATPAQVALRWLIDQDHVAAIPKATSPERIEENFGAQDFELSDEERRRIDGLERGERLIDPGWAPDWEA